MESTQSTGSLWQNSVFRKMFAAYTMSTFGDWLDMLAVMVLIGYVWESDPVVIALLPVMYALPGVLFGSIAGVIADRWKKLNLMIIADLVTSVLTVGLLFAPSVYWALAFVLVRAFVGVFKVPAHQALTRHVVREDQLLKATSMNGIVMQVTRVAGPLLGASLLAVFTPQISIAINAAMLFLSALVLLTMRNIKENRAVAQEQAAPKSFREDWKAGLAIILNTRTVLASVILSFFGITALQMIDAQVVVLLREFYPSNSSILGWVMASASSGAAVSIMIIQRFQNLKYGLVLGLGYLLIGIGFGTVGFVKPDMSLLVLLVAHFIAGFGFGMTIVGSNFILQKETPPEAVGRVFGIQGSLTNLSVIIAPPLGGMLVKVIGLSPAYVGVASASALVGLIGILGAKWIFRQKQQVQEQSSMSA